MIPDVKKRLANAYQDLQNQVVNIDPMRNICIEANYLHYQENSENADIDELQEAQTVLSEISATQ